MNCRRIFLILAALLISPASQAEDLSREMGLAKAVVDAKIGVMVGVRDGSNILELANLYPGLSKISERALKERQAIDELGLAYSQAVAEVIDSSSSRSGSEVRLDLKVHELLKFSPRSREVGSPKATEEVVKYRFLFRDGELQSASIVAPFQALRLDPNQRWELDYLPTTSVTGYSAPGLFFRPVGPTQGAASPADALDFSAAAIAVSKSIVVSYATKYWFNYNNSYRFFSSDCTNFVSQAVYEGGWSMVSGFYTQNNVWWYNFLNQSYTWAGAQNWANFIRTANRGYVAPYFSNLVPGDILQMDFQGDGSIDHSMIVTAKDRSGNLFLTYHTTDTLNKPLAAIQKLYPSARYFGWSLY